MIRIVLFRFLETYFRHRWLYLLPSVLILIAAGLYFSSRESEYIARGNVYVQDESLLASLNSVTDSSYSMWVTPAQNTSSKVNELLITDAFIRAVIHKTDLENEIEGDEGTVDELIKETRRRIWITTLGNNQIQINAAQANPQVAVQIVNGIIESYIQWEVNSQRSESETAQAFFADQIVKYESDLETASQNLKVYLEVNPAPISGERSEIEILEISRLQNSVDLAETRYLSALEKEENARLALAQIESVTRESYMIIDAPRLPEKPEISRKEIAIQAAIFVVVALLLDVVAVIGGMLLDRSFRLPLDLQVSTGLPVLTMVPDMTVPSKKNKRLARFGRKQLQPGSQQGSESEASGSQEHVIETEPVENIAQVLDVETELKP